MLKKEKYCCCKKEEILMPVNIISENRIAGIVKIHGLPGKIDCSNSGCLLLSCCCLPVLFCLCCCPCFYCECRDCYNSDKNSSDCCDCDCNCCN